MIGNTKLVIIIPARAGSKGIKGKNLIKLDKYSLLERSILLAKNCEDCVDKIIVTTDSHEMYEIATQYGVAAPTLRPVNLSGDFARSIEVLIHIIGQCNLEDDYIMMLQPTSPLRTTSDLRAVVELLNKNLNTCDAVASVTELISTHPEKVQKIEDGYLTTYIPGVLAERPRQEMPKAYRLNGAFYLTHASIILKQKTLLPKNTLPYFMPDERAVNLDHTWDILLLEAMLTKGIVTLEEFSHDV